MFHVEHLSSSVINKLNIYKDTLLKWQKAVNLVSRGTLDDIWNRHIKDSLKLLPYLRGQTVLDIGSGGGFPGMVLAIIGQDSSFEKYCENFNLQILAPLNVTCLDSDSKKMLFLSEVARKTATKVNLVTERIENYRGNFDNVTARGFSDLSSLIKIAKRFSSRGVFLKGQKAFEELQEAFKTVNFKFEFEMYPSITSASGRIVIIKTLENDIQYSIEL